MTITSPVVTATSQATRACGSSVRIASSTASEIWSQILSGCPSVTDSEVSNFFSVMGVLSFAQLRRRGRSCRPENGDHPCAPARALVRAPACDPPGEGRARDPPFVAGITGRVVLAPWRLNQVAGPLPWAGQHPLDADSKWYRGSLPLAIEQSFRTRRDGVSQARSLRTHRSP